MEKREREERSYLGGVAGILSAELADSLKKCPVDAGFILICCEDDGTGEERFMTGAVHGNAAVLIEGLAHFLASPRNGNIVDKAIRIAFENRAKAWAEISRSQSDSQSSCEDGGC